MFVPCRLRHIGAAGQQFWDLTREPCRSHIFLHLESHQREGSSAWLGLQEMAIGPQSRLWLRGSFSTVVHCSWPHGPDHSLCSSGWPGTCRSARLCLLKAGFKGFVRAVLSIQRYSWGQHSQAGGSGFSGLKPVQTQLDLSSVLGL